MPEGMLSRENGSKRASSDLTSRWESCQGITIVEENKRTLWLTLGPFAINIIGVVAGANRIK